MQLAEKKMLGLNRQELLMLGGTAAVVAVMLKIGFGGGGGAEAVELHASPSVIPSDPTPGDGSGNATTPSSTEVETSRAQRPVADVATCGPPVTAAALRKLFESCHGYRDECPQPAMQKVDMRNIIFAAQEMPYTLVFFPFGVTDVDQAGKDRIVDFVDRTAAERPDHVILGFGSASPPGGNGINEKVGRLRTRSFYKIAFDHIMQAGEKTSRLGLFRSNVGSSSLRNLGSYCELLADSPVKNECLDLPSDDDRRQVAIIIAVPRACVEGAK